MPVSGAGSDPFVGRWMPREMSWKRSKAPKGTYPPRLLFFVYQIHCRVARWKARHQSYLFIPSKASNKPLIGRYNRKFTQRSGEKLRQPSKNSDKTRKPFSNEKKAFGEESNTNRKRLDKIGRNKGQQTKDVATETMPPPRRSVVPPTAKEKQSELVRPADSQDNLATHRIVTAPSLRCRR